MNSTHERLSNPSHLTKWGTSVHATPVRATAHFPTTRASHQPIARKHKALVAARPINLAAILGVLGLFLVYASVVMILVSNTRHPVKTPSIDTPAHATLAQPALTAHAAADRVPSVEELQTAPRPEIHDAIAVFHTSQAFDATVAGAGAHAAKSSTLAKPSPAPAATLGRTPPPKSDDSSAHYGLQSMD